MRMRYAIHQRTAGPSLSIFRYCSVFTKSVPSQKRRKHAVGIVVIIYINIPIMQNNVLQFMRAKSRDS